MRRHPVQSLGTAPGAMAHHVLLPLGAPLHRRSMQKQARMRLAVTLCCLGLLAAVLKAALGQAVAGLPPLQVGCGAVGGWTVATRQLKAHAAAMAGLHSEQGSFAPSNPPLRRALSPPLPWRWRMPTTLCRRA